MSSCRPVVRDNRIRMTGPLADRRRSVSGVCRPPTVGGVGAADDYSPGNQLGISAEAAAPGIDSGPDAKARA
jgi:hypothetical protein